MQIPVCGADNPRENTQSALHNQSGPNSNPQPHQKQGVRKLSELDKQSLLARQKKTC
jgi:hypothetical protein